MALVASEVELAMQGLCRAPSPSAARTFSAQFHRVAAGALSVQIVITWSAGQPLEVLANRQTRSRQLATRMVIALPCEQPRVLARSGRWQAVQGEYAITAAVEQATRIL